jgi:hypothetical protein
MSLVLQQEAPPYIHSGSRGVPTVLQAQALVLSIQTVIPPNSELARSPRFYAASATLMTEKIRWNPTYFGGIRQGRNDGVVSYIAFGRRQNSMKRDKVQENRKRPDIGEGYGLLTR